ncbi:hypothetical protein AT2G07280 [Arabidopsis thaliana]|uniref:Uncharacterized protein n=1 Tax=Arabidopsis thaliana TaxID=3702 RepID=F4IK99_ARATH|nr:uncharacterized protein AT2G07280 [Arabidopsis thaliana]AEC06044.1 hypothetical protein AT2G07280 [Arabidopsis thaliana]|eukprot:NP_178738.4 hypothetical protein AT2G07280 [Arabidopsis thaliana]
MAEITEDPNIVPPVATLTDPSDDIVILDWDNVWIPRQSRLLADVHAVEQDRDDDEVRDKKVSYMLEKIQSGYGFAKYEWPGGVMSLDLIDIVKTRSNKKKKMKPLLNSPKGSVKRRRSTHLNPDLPPSLSQDLAARVDSLENKIGVLKAQLKKVSDRNTLIQNRFRDSRFLHATRRAKPSMFRFKKLVRNSASETTSRFMHARWRAKPTFLRELFGKDTGEQDWTHFEHPLGGLDRNSEPQLSSRLDDIQMEETIESFNTALTEHQSENTDKESEEVGLDVPTVISQPLKVSPDVVPEASEPPLSAQDKPQEFPSVDINIGLLNDGTLNREIEFPEYQPNGEQVFKTPIHNQVHHTIPNTYTLFLHCFCISIINTPQCKHPFQISLMEHGMKCCPSVQLL